MPGTGENDMSEDAGAAAQGDLGAQDGQESVTDGGQSAAGGGTIQGGTAVQGPSANGNGAGGSDDDAAELLASMAAGDGTEQDSPDTQKQQIDHWKQMARKNEQRARANAAAAKELEEIKRSQMSEQERLQAERDQYRQEAAETTAQLNRMMAAAAYDLDPELIDFLGTGTEDEINNRAETLAAAVNRRVEAAVAAAAGANAQQNGQGAQNGQNGQDGGQQPANPFFRNRIPVESLRPGAAPASDNVARNPNDMFREMLGR